MNSYSLMILYIINKYLDKLKIKQLREGQQESIKAFLHGSDVLVGLPTGHGKSLCYEVGGGREFFGEEKRL